MQRHHGDREVRPRPQEEEDRRRLQQKRLPEPPAAALREGPDHRPTGQAPAKMRRCYRHGQRRIGTGCCRALTINQAAPLLAPSRVSELHIIYPRSKSRTSDTYLSNK